MGTIAVAYLALFPKKPKEKIECWYWLLGSIIRVAVINKSSINCVIEKGIYLLITMGGNGELKSEPLEMQEIIPAHLTCNIHYRISENIRRLLLSNPHIEMILYTERGTVVKLKKGMYS